MLSPPQRKNPSHAGYPVAPSIIIGNARGYFNFSVPVAHVPFRLCVLLVSLQCGVWLTEEMVLKVTHEMPLIVAYLYSCLSFMQETGPENNRARSHIMCSYD